MGRLQFRRRSTGQIEAYYVYAFEGSPFSLKIGAYDRTGIIGFTLAHCRKQAQEFAALHKEHPHLKRWLEEEQRRIEREQAAAVACGTFADLIDSYVDYLRTQNRSSADAVQRELTVSVKKAFPELARKRGHTGSALIVPLHAAGGGVGPWPSSAGIFRDIAFHGHFINQPRYG